MTRKTLIGALVCFPVIGGAIAACGVGSSRVMETPPPQMKLISESQYRNTIADIFGDDIKVVGRFEEVPEVDNLSALGATHVSISSRGYERYFGLATTIAEQLVSDDHWEKVVPCDDEEAGISEVCLRESISSIGERLLRRPMSTEELDLWVAEIRKSTEALGGERKGVALAIEGMLASPSFLFLTDDTEPDPDGDGIRLTAFAKAHRLSFFLWNSVPDEELLEVARTGEIHSPRVLKAEVNRMVQSDRIQAGAQAFFEDFLNLDRFDTLEKDKVIYPAFNKRAAVDAKEQVLRFLDHQLIEKEEAYPTIFTSKDTFMTRPLGMIYRVPVKKAEGWEPYRFADDDPRAGLLSQVGFTALHSHPGRSSATLRGIAIRELLLCQSVEPAPAAVNFTVVQDTHNPNFRTARERLTQHRTDPACSSCHEFIDPAGLALENFDGMGAFRKTENGARIDTSGELDGYLFSTLPDVEQTIANHPGAPACLVEKAQKFALGREPEGEELAWRSRLEKAFERKGQKFPELLKDIALSDEFYSVGEPARTGIQAASVDEIGGKS